MSKTNRTRILLSFLLITAATVSCRQDKNITYHEYVSAKNAELYKKDLCKFEFQIEDTAVYYNIKLEIRNNNRYKFKNIWLFLSLKDSIKTIETDTVECMLADKNGQWYGKGLSLYDKEFLFKKGIKFHREGKYTYVINQAMKEDPLIGISDIGIKIIPSESCK